MIYPLLGDIVLCSWARQKNEVCNIINCVTIYYEKDVRAGMPSSAHPEKKVLSQDVEESEDGSVLVYGFTRE